MKLVQQKYRQEKKLIVSENIIKRGFDFESNQDFLTDADQEKYNEYLETIAKNYMSFREWLEKNNIEYLFLPECYISIEEIKELAEKHKYFFDDDNNEFIKTEEILQFEECNYIEYWNGHDTEQVEIIDDIIDLELIDEDIVYNKALHGQYDLYKDTNDNYYLHFKSYYQGQLGSVEAITKKELLEDYNYKL